LIAVEDPEKLLKTPERPEERFVMELPPKAKSKYFTTITQDLRKSWNVLFSPATRQG